MRHWSDWRECALADPVRFAAKNTDRSISRFYLFTTTIRIVREIACVKRIHSKCIVTELSTHPRDFVALVVRNACRPKIGSLEILTDKLFSDS